MNTVTEPGLRDSRKQAFEANKLSKKLHRQVGQEVLYAGQGGARTRPVLQREIV